MSNASLQVDAEGVVRLAGVIDFDSAGSVRDGLQQAAAGGQGPLVLDMSGVTQANSVGLSLILRLCSLSAPLWHLGRECFLASCLGRTPISLPSCATKRWDS